MKTIGITGGGGFLGWHLRAYFLPFKDIEVVSINRDVFNDDAKFLEVLKKCNVVVHCAGMNRGEESEVYKVNKGLAERLLEFINKAGTKPHLIFSSSVHIDRDTSYGKSKKEVGEMFLNWGKEKNAPVTVLVLPNIFGEFGKPNYNSAVATFCSQIVKGEDSMINAEAPIALIHVQDVAKKIHHVIEKKEIGEIRIGGEKTTIGAVYEALRDFHQEYTNYIVPQPKSAFDTALFNTLRSYLPKDFYPQKLSPKSDPRGTLFESVKHRGQGQTFFSTTVPGAVRGNHYHKRKLERILVVQGEAEIELRKLMSDEIILYKVNGEEPQFIDMPTFYTHNIKNTGTTPLTTLFWISEIFNADDPDTYPMNV